MEYLSWTATYVYSSPKMTLYYYCRQDVIECNELRKAKTEIQIPEPKFFGFQESSVRALLYRMCRTVQHST
jgi:hypothetical protein